MKETLELTHAEQMLFALLRAALRQDAADVSFFTDLSQADWKECQLLASRQGVLALAWDGVTTLPTSLQPTKAVKISWAMAVERCEDRYHRHCRTIADLSRLYAEHGITTVQMKGVALSDYYPNPSHRQCGDIDIFTFSADTTKLSHKEANHLADKLMEQQGLTVNYEHPKHSVFHFEGVMIENHKTFINVDTYDIAARTDQLLRQSLNPLTLRLDGQFDILVPSHAFNTLFLSFHAAQHIGDGLSIHHLCDCACLLNKQGLHIPEEVTDKKLHRLLWALTWICDKYLGTDVCVEDKDAQKLAEVILADMLRPPFQKTVPTSNPFGLILYKTRRMLYMRRLRDRLLGLSLSRWIGKSVVYHLRHPHTIFKQERG